MNDKVTNFKRYLQNKNYEVKHFSALLQPGKNPGKCLKADLWKPETQ